MRTILKVEKATIQKRENGVRVLNLVLQSGLARSPIYTILRTIKAIKEVKAA